MKMLKLLAVIVFSGAIFSSGVALEEEELKCATCEGDAALCEDNKVEETAVEEKTIEAEEEGCGCGGNNGGNN